MNKRIIVSGVVLVALGSAQFTDAIAVEDYSVAETNPAIAGYSLDWDYVYQYQNSTAVAVDHYWLLTAAHVADDGNSATNLTINGELYTQQEIIYNDEADLALVRYDKPFLGYYLLNEGEIYVATTNTISGSHGRDQTEITYSYDELIMVGFGYGGTVTNDSFTQSGTYPYGVKRWGTNRGVDTDFEYSNDVGGEAGARTTIYFEVSFDLDDTDYEAGGNVFDSGGGYFIEKDGTWKLAGINLLRGGSNPYTGNYAAQVSEYVGWITNNIPDYDTDMDGLPDHWEETYGSMNAEEDPDLDGFSNYEEWMADTDPTESTSHFEILEWNAPSNVVFTSSSNRKYLIEFRESMDSEDWATQVDWFSGSDIQTAQNISGLTSNRFYRIRVKLR